jgi:hypothetical protein
MLRAPLSPAPTRAVESYPSQLTRTLQKRIGIDLYQATFKEQIRTRFGTNRTSESKWRTLLSDLELRFTCRLAAGAARMCGRTSTGKKMNGALGSQLAITISTIRNTRRSFLCGEFQH